MIAALLARYWHVLAAALVLAGAFWWVTALMGERDDLRAENAALTRSIAAMERQAEQARLAADVARAAAGREAARAAEYDALREALLRGKTDAELPDWFRDYLRHLGFGGVPNNNAN